VVYPPVHISSSLINYLHPRKNKCCDTAGSPDRIGEEGAHLKLRSRCGAPIVSILLAASLALNGPARLTAQSLNAGTLRGTVTDGTAATLLGFDRSGEYPHWILAPGANRGGRVQSFQVFEYFDHTRRTARKHDGSRAIRLELKQKGTAADQAILAVTAELKTKYPDWTDNPGNAIRRVYEEP
jgi:hypothetical protein